MSNESRRFARPRRRLPRVPALYPVPLRATHNGWSPDRQAHFLGHLAETGSVSAVWDAALGSPVRRVTIDDLRFLAYRGLIRPRFRGGKHIGSRQKPDNSALLRLLPRYDPAPARVDRRGDKSCSKIRDLRVTKGDTCG